MYKDIGLAKISLTFTFGLVSPFGRPRLVPQVRARNDDHGELLLSSTAAVSHAYPILPAKNQSVIRRDLSYSGAEGEEKKSNIDSKGM